MPAPLATDYTQHTIAALATPPGEGGVGIVRLSGPNAVEIAARLFRSSRGRDISTATGWHSFHGHVLDGEIRLDEVLLHVMRAPHSYTREDVVEICGHGGIGPMNEILELCLAQGATLAQPGEFTLRAFLNGRIDLVQAEAVIDQIQARTRAGMQAAMAASSGVLSRSLYSLKERLAHALAQIEAAVDFPEDDLPALITPALLDSLHETHRDMLALLDTATAGRLYREGVAIAIAGRPNVGKSSLFNALLRDTRAIVSKHAGTTRDRIEEHFTLRGVPVRLIDTAGLRDTADEVEQAGVALARAAMQQAQAVLFVADQSVGFTVEDAALAEEALALGTPTLLVWNKCDLPIAGQVAQDERFTQTCHVSALTGEGIAALEEALAALLLGGLHQDASQPMLTRLHQKDSLRRAADCIARLLEDPARSPEFLALDLQEALDAIGEITGETTPDDILGAIFASFCIGK
jgi:tRNA modification GTPase